MSGGVAPADVQSKTAVLLELVKFEHSVFALPYAYIGALYGAAVLSDGWPEVAALIWITIVMVGARAFAFVLNRAIDKEIDARNPRTAGRAIPAGLIKARELWLFAAVMLAAYLFGVWQLAPLAQLLWPIPLLAFLVYPYTKRFTPLCHYWLGLCLGLAPVGGWVAVGAPIVHPAPWLLGAAVMLWTAGFDMIYATQDVECDVRDGVHSMPADIGVAAALLQTRIAHILTVALLGAGGWFAGAGWPWFLGTGLAAALLWYENSIVSPNDLTRVNAAFFTVNGIIAIIVGIGAVADRLVG
ncbi:MAG: UbiA-like polyprenyltransferase [Actinomycetota bacterium]|nr:UbiA-like polyprenyltransferase [Actinomycetota bacterium]MDZ4179281.1 UbiA-like polyprenyltransferase [Coriobacteriia bacterium]